MKVIGPITLKQMTDANGKVIIKVEARSKMHFKRKDLLLLRAVVTELIGPTTSRERWELYYLMHPEERKQQIQQSNSKRKQV